jgi:hypothetical protein
MTQAAINFGDSIEKGARQTGLSIEEYQKWNYVIKQSGGNIDGMGMAFKTLAKNAAASSQILGVSTRDTNGNLKSMGQLFEELTMKIAGIANPTERAAAAQKAFGRGGQEVFAMASMGKDKISELIGETSKYGLILGGDIVKRFDEAKKAQEAMNLSWRVASAEIMVNLIPVIKQLLPLVTDLALGMGWIFGGEANSDEALKKQQERSEVYIKQLKDFYQRRKDLLSGKGSGGAAPTNTNLNDIAILPIDEYLKKGNQSVKEELKTLDDSIAKIKKEYADLTHKPAAPNDPSQFDFEKEAKKKKPKEDDEMFGVSKALSSQLSEMRGNAKLISDVNISLGDSFLKSLDTSKAQMDKYVAIQKEKIDLDSTLKKEQVKNFKKYQKENEDIYAAGLITEEEYLRNKNVLSEKELELQKKQVNFAMQMGEAYGNAIGSGFEKGGYNVHKALKALLDMTVDFLSKEALAAVASNTLQNVVSEGYWGLVVGAAEAAGIEVLAEAAKAGISSFAGGTSYARGGMSLVGERGPELMNVPRGSQIYNANQTSTMMSSGHTFNITLNASGSVAESLHAEVRAGDPGVQKLLGILSQRLS